MKAFDSKGININIGDRVWNIEEKLCYLLDDGDMAYKLTERAKKLSGVSE